MTIEEDIQRLKDGVDGWNQWRDENEIHEVDLRGGDFSGDDLRGANLSRSDLSGADLRGARLKGAELFNANLQGADLRGVKRLRLNQTYVKGAHFDYYAKDPWSVLRRKYTGPKLIFTLLFFVAFMLPYVAKVLFWSSVSRAQKFTEALLDERASAVGLDTEPVTNLARCLADNCELVPAWKLILPFYQESWIWILAVALIAYNFIKAIQTWYVAEMRDHEERTGYTPLWVDRFGFGYWFSYFWHWVLLVLFGAAVVVFFINAHHWLFQGVWIPGGP